MNTGLTPQTGIIPPFETITFTENSSTDLVVETSTYGPAAVTNLAPDYWDVSFANLGNFPGFYIYGNPASAWEEPNGLVNFAQTLSPYDVKVWSDVSLASTGQTPAQAIPLGSGFTSFGDLVYELDPPFPFVSIPLGANFHETVPDTGDTLGLLFTALVALIFSWKFPAWKRKQK